MVRELLCLLAILFSLRCHAVNPSKLRFNTAAQNAAFAPPLGLGAILFKPNVKIVKSEGDDERLVDASNFFVDAFW